MHRTVPLFICGSVLSQAPNHQTPPAQRPGSGGGGSGEGRTDDRKRKAQSPRGGPPRGQLGVFPASVGGSALRAPANVGSMSAGGLAVAPDASPPGNRGDGGAGAAPVIVALSPVRHLHQPFSVRSHHQFVAL